MLFISKCTSDLSQITVANTQHTVTKFIWGTFGNVWKTNFNNLLHILT